MIFEPNKNPYVHEVDGTIESLRKAIGDGLSIKISIKETKIPGLVIIQAENGIALRLKQNPHSENIVGTFVVAKYVDNELVSLNREEIEYLLTGGLS
jgi:hypothetical protein